MNDDRLIPAGAFFLALMFVSVSLAEQPPFSPQRSAQRMQVPEGFHVTLVAGEPDLVKPIAMHYELCCDEKGNGRGRLWVVESRSYPNWLPEGKEGRDRVLIFEDKKSSGHFDSCKVFLDNGTNLSGIALGFGGVWLCATPNLLFIPLHPGGDKPAGPPKVILDGWSLQAKHNVFNTLVWGPDGFLYGCNGILATSLIGRPGTPKEERIALNCGVWRYHPVKETFEPFAWGTTNPWGLDFDDYGEAFITNCVIKHLFHVIPGAHYTRMYGQDLNPNCYDLLASCADHIHWGGGAWTTSRGGQGVHDAPGGGHAHAGAMVYLGDNWPAEYRNHVFMCNIHGARVNQDVLERHGSGYVAHHGKDFLLAHDSWFRGLTLLYGPDGGVFVSDWHDTGECHDYDRVEPCGRIFKVTFGQPPAVSTDLSRLSDAELVRLQLHKNDWWVRGARRLLQERTHAGKLDKDVRPALTKMLNEQKDVTRKLRALWALHVTGPLDEKSLLDLLDSPHEEIRRWAVRLLVEDKPISNDAKNRLAQVARSDKSASVRLALASALQRLPLAKRWVIAEQLVGHAEDATDENLPLMIWYGIEPLASFYPDRAMNLVMKSKIPLVRKYLARRIAALDSPLAPLVRSLVNAADAVQLDVLRGMHDALQGRRNVTAPEGWSGVYRNLSDSKNAEIREKVLQLSVLFGDPQALAALRKTAADPKADAASRRTALQTLIEKRPPDLLPLLRQLITDRDVRGLALRGLASYRDPTTPALILEHYATFSDAEKADAVATLASRPEYALTLLDAMEQGRVPRRDLSAFTVRQLLTFNDRKLTERLTRIWGTIRPPSQEKTAALAKYRAMVPADALKKANRKHGRALFVRNCATCHTLFGEGGKIGPDLTGSQRANPEYLLTKLLDPSAVVARDYQMTIITTTAGRILSGLVKEESDKTLTLQTQNEVVRLPKSDIDDRRRSELSMMPDGLLAPLSAAEVRDLIAYVSGEGQVPLPPEVPGTRK
jgi:putative membrane-bound dehydrogenase-like protein